MTPTISLADRPLTQPPPSAETHAILDNNWTVGQASLPGLAIAFHLTDPAALYAQQRQRALWFGSLLLVAAATALAGFAAARRAYHRQLRLNEMKSNFVASVSHELRAPIASVRLMAEGLARGTVQNSEKQRDYFRFIVQECRRLSSLVENVLDFSRIEQGRREYDFEPTDLAALVEQTTNLMQPYAAARKLRLETAIAPDVTSHPALDGKAIQQALVNLIDNAIKHSPADTVVEIDLRADPNARALLLSVTDHGEGIPAEEHERIFERFHRLGSELRRETEGAGIGLSLVKHIVEAHHGKAHVQSHPSPFTKFTIELPLPPP